MTSRTHEKRNTASAGPPLAAQWIERACLLVLVSMIPLRAFISETHTFELPRLFRSLDAPGTALPATTFLIFALVMLVGATMAVCRLRFGGTRYAATGMGAGAALLIAAMVISTVRAGQKHLANIGCLDFLGMLLYAAVLRQLLTRPWHVRLVLVVIVAAGSVMSAKCAYQKWVETPETIRYFEENRAELTAGGADGKDADAGFLHDYEQRLRSGAVSGYFSHPNVLASFLILIVLSGIAVVHERWRRGRTTACIVPAVLTACAMAALVFAQSKGASTACIVALVIWVFGSLLARRVRRRPGMTAAAIWLCGAAVAIVVPLLLAARPEILGRSMLYRWFYWRAATEMIADQGAWGVGAGNFGRFFTRYKDVACPEDVDDPHGWMVKAAAEWGYIGLIGLLLLFAGVTMRLMRAARTSTVDAPRDGPQQRDGSIILWLAATGGLVFGWWAVLLIGATDNYAALVLHLPAIVWAVAFFACAWEGGEKTISDAPLGGLLPALIGGLVGFLLHAGVDLALFQPGAATTFFALVAVTLAVAGGLGDALPSGERTVARPEGRGSSRQTAARPEGRGSSGGHGRLGWVVGTVGAMASIGVLAGLAIPAALLGEDFRPARTSKRPARWRDYVNSASCDAYRRAVDRYRWDATAADELLDELTSRVETIEHANEAMKLLAVLEQRDPASAVRFQHAATLHYQRFVLSGDAKDIDAAIAAMQQAVSAYPTAPRKRLMLADLYEKKAAAMRDASPDAADPNASVRAAAAADARRHAAEQIRRALQFDAERIYVSLPHRFAHERRALLEERIRRLESP